MPEPQTPTPGSSGTDDFEQAVAQFLMQQELARRPVPVASHGAPVRTVPSHDAATMRAATTSERLGDLVRSLYEGAAAQPLGRVADALGVSDLGGVARSFSEPETGTRLGIMPGPPEARLGDIIKAAKPRGLYSRVDDVAAQIPAKGAHPNKVASMLKSGASSEEVSHRKVQEFLASLQQQNQPVTREALQAHLQANPAPFPAVRTLGAKPAVAAPEPHPDLDRWLHSEYEFDYPESYADWDEVEKELLRQYRATTDGTPESRRLFDLVDHAAAQRTAAELAERGGAAPVPAPELMARLRDWGIEPTTRADWEEAVLDLEHAGFARAPRQNVYGDGQWYVVDSDGDWGVEGYPTQEAAEAAMENQPLPTLARQARAHLEALKYAEGGEPQFEKYTLPGGEDYRETLLQQTQGAEGPDAYRHQHWDTPNVLVHSRSNVRELPTGERGRFLEEIQSDWNQAGKEYGYQGDPNAPHRWQVVDKDGQGIGSGVGRTAEEALADWQSVAGAQAEQGVGAVDIPADAGYRSTAVPDNPFKEHWPDLAFKQQLLEAVNDPSAQWIGWTVGETQNRRYNLRQVVDRLDLVDYHGALHLSGWKNGKVLKPLDSKRVNPKELRKLLGKELAEKLLAQPASDPGATGRTYRTLAGKDIDVGGRGMVEFYDKLLPARVQKLLAPFGGKVERMPVQTGYGKVGDRMQIDHEPAWVVRLTPEMKAKIRAAGLPLLALPLAVSHEQEPEP